MPHYVLAPDAITDTHGRPVPSPTMNGVPRQWWAGGFLVHSEHPDLLQKASAGISQDVTVLVQGSIDGLGSDGDEEPHIYARMDQAFCDAVNASRPDSEQLTVEQTGPFQVVVDVAHVLGVWDEQAAADLVTQRRRWLRENCHPRLIKNTEQDEQHPWPDDAHVQGGGDGLVFRSDGTTYRTAFVEVSIRGAHRTFIRGEASTVAAAEDAAWADYQRQAACPSGHASFETRGYRNGLGFCTRCGMSKHDAFDVREVGHPCTVCGVGCFYTVRDGKWFCREHAPADDPFGDDD